MQGGGVYKRRQMAYPVAAQRALCGRGGRVPRLRRGEGAVEGYRRRRPAQHLADVRADARVHAGGLCADRGGGRDILKAQAKKRGGAALRTWEEKRL